MFEFYFLSMCGFIWIFSMLITACFCMYNYNAVSGEASHIWHIATGHAMQIFNDLHYSFE
jgi:hypothetical protein